MKKLRVALIIVVIAAVLIVVLFVIAGVVYLPKLTAHRNDTARAEALVIKAMEKRDALREAARQAREAMPPDAPIPSDWTFSDTVSALEAYRCKPFFIVVVGILDNPDTLSQKALDRLSTKTELAIDSGTATPMEIALAPSRHSVDEISDYVLDHLKEADELRVFETGMGLGLCVGAALEKGMDFFRTQACIGRLCAMLAARAIGEVRQGKPDKALKTCFNAYATLDLLSSPCAGLDGFAQRQGRSNDVDSALWYVLDVVEPTPEAKRVILERFERRKETGTLIEATRVSGAEMQIGDAGFAVGFELPVTVSLRLARGALAEAEKAVSLLELPPAEASARFSAPTAPAPAPSGYAGILNADFKRTFRSYLNAASGADAARVAFALKDYKAAGGAYPPSLASLLPDYLAEIPVDSQGGALLQYEPSEDGFILRTIASFGEHRVVWRARR